MKPYLVIGLIGILAIIAIPMAQARLHSPSAQLDNINSSKNDQATQISLDELVKSAPVILLAEVIDSPSNIQTPKNHDNVQKPDLERALKRATEGHGLKEERVYLDLKMDLKTIRLKTTQTLKGPKTDILGLPMTDKDFNSAKTGDLFLIMLGVQHPDAIKKVRSNQDPWVKRVMSILE